MTRWIGLFVFCATLTLAALAAVRGNAVMYIGGTLPLPERTMGRLDLAPPTAALFQPDKTDQAASTAGAAVVVAIPYASIQSLEYGEKLGRRLGVALAVSPLFLFSHKRRHFLTLTFKDAQGATQGAVFEIGKRDIRGALARFSAQSKVAVEYESKEAQTYAEKN